jgi:Subtilase family
MTRNPPVHLCAVAVLFLTSSSLAAALTLRLPTNVPVPSATTRTKSLPLSQAFSRMPSTPNCLANAFEMPGQAWHTDLTGGGIRLDAQRPDTQTSDTRPPTFEALYGFPASWLDGGSSDSELMVIDHFAFAPLKIRTATGEQTLMLNHGALVEAHLRSILDSAGFTVRSQQPLRYGRGTRTLTITRLDLSTQVYGTKGLNSGPVPSAALALALQQRLQSDGKSLVPRDLVLNMSFAMIPCQAMNIYRDLRQTWAAATPARRYNLNTFLQDVALESNLSLTDVQHELTTVSDTEPLKREIAALSAQRRARGAGFVAVASSGNFGLGYATAPGAFPNVISAGLYRWDRQPATDQDGQVWPDAADVNVAAEWFTLSASQLQRYCREGGTCVTEDIVQAPQRYGAFSYRGTSFAAPTVSLFLAFQQGPANSCFTASGTGYRPVSKADLSTPQRAFDFAQAWKDCGGGPM